MIIWKNSYHISFYFIKPYFYIEFLYFIDKKLLNSILIFFLSDFQIF